MYKKNKADKTAFKINTSVEGESIEMKVRRITENKEPITDGAPIIHTPRKDGVRPEHNIRTDRFEMAIDMTDKMTKDKLAAREERHSPAPETGGSPDGKPDSNVTTSGKTE